MHGPIRSKLDSLVLSQCSCMGLFVHPNVLVCVISGKFKVGASMVRALPPFSPGAQIAESPFALASSGKIAPTGAIPVMRTTFSWQR